MNKPLSNWQTRDVESVLRPGDVIMSINGQQVENTADLARLVGSTRPGTEVTAQAWRNGKDISARIKVAALER